MRDDIKELTNGIQDSMVESAKSYFVEAELADLRCLIWVTGEFLSYLQVTNAHTRPQSQSDGSKVKAPFLRNLTAGMKPSIESFIDEMDWSDSDLSYTIETVFSGVDSFSSVTAAYRALVGPTSSTINWNSISVSTFNEQFTSKFYELAAESSFEKQCRLLLDLFKLQLVFAGFWYG